MTIHDNGSDTGVTLRFEARAVQEQLDHTKAAPQHKLTMSDRAELYGEDKAGHAQPYEETNGTPGLWLVKDEGIYLMSNGKPGLLNTESNDNHRTQLKVVFARGYEPLADYNKIREAVGGDDFTMGTFDVEDFEAVLQFAKQHQRDEILIELTETEIRFGC